jgi:hypothetical protein
MEGNFGLYDHGICGIRCVIHSKQSELLEIFELNGRPPDMWPVAAQFSSGSNRLILLKNLLL